MGNEESVAAGYGDQPNQGVGGFGGVGGTLGTLSGVGQRLTAPLAAGIPRPSMPNIPGISNFGSGLMRPGGIGGGMSMRTPGPGSLLGHPSPAPPAATGGTTPIPDVDLSHLSAEERAMIESVMMRAQEAESVPETAKGPSFQPQTQKPK